MIPKGLKVGENYLEGNLVYEVTKVVAEGIYEGRWTGETSSTPSVSTTTDVKSEKKVVKEEVKVDYLSMPYAQLKKLCADRGIDAKGSKAELIARLEG